MDHVEAPRLLCLVRLQVTDEVPADREIGGLVDLLKRLLNLVFAEVDLAGVRGGADKFCGKGFRDRDDPDGRGVASGPDGRARDGFAYAGQPGPERSGIDHSFFGSDPRML